MHGVKGIKILGKEVLAQSANDTTVLFDENPGSLSILIKHY